MGRCLKFGSELAEGPNRRLARLIFNATDVGVRDSWDRDLSLRQTELRSAGGDALADRLTPTASHEWKLSRVAKRMGIQHAGLSWR
jgi:hypothetical protein